MHNEEVQKEVRLRVRFPCFMLGISLIICYGNVDMSLGFRVCIIKRIYMLSCTEGASLLFGAPPTLHAQHIIANGTHISLFYLLEH